MSAEELLAQDFGAFPDLVRAHARERADHAALIEGDAILTYRELAALMDRIAFGLQRDGVSAGEAVAICARASIPYAAAFCGALAAGAVVAPLAPSSTAAGLAMMIEDCSAKILFLDREMGQALEGVSAGRATLVALDDSAAGTSLSRWLGPEGAKPDAVEFRPDWPFNIIYSSGTTGAPKGIVQSHAMRWRQLSRISYNDAVTLVSTPLYSNTTLVVF